MKRILSLLLAIVMVFSLSGNVFAASDDTVKATSNEKNSEMEDALVDTSSLTSEALEIINQYIAQAEDDSFYITDADALKKALTKEQYNAVLAQIDALKGSKSRASTPDGSESNPYELKDGVEKKASSSDCWFKGPIWGAVKFYITSSRSAAVSIYKKTLFGKTSIYTSTATAVGFVLSDCSINNGKNTYIINVKPVSTASIVCRITTHKDSYTRSAGAMWTAKSDSAMYNTNVLYFKYWYVPASKIPAIIDYVDRQDFLDNQKKLVDGSVTAASIALGIITAGGSSVPVGVLTSVISGVGGLGISQIVDFKAAIKNNIRTAGGFNASTGQYTKGVLLIEFMSNGSTIYNVNSWSGSTMYGPEGWTGTWSTAYN